MNRLYTKYKWFLPLIAIALFAACKPAANKYSWPGGYDFNDPEKFNMPGSLLEISGIDFHQGNGKAVYSVQDEEGKLFKQNWGNAKQINVKFGSGGDFEDVAILDETVFVLKSSGSIITFPLAEIEHKETKKVKEWKKILPKGEYESLYADRKDQTLYTVCKNCNIDKKTKDATVYALNFDSKSGELTLAGDFKIKGEQVEAFGQDIRSGLKISALAKHPKTGEWYLLSSVHRLLVIARPDWTIKEVHQLSSSMFNQPEGIAFDENFNLYISNEGDELSAGNILKFKYKPVK
jgi:hypothetical protein